MALALTGAAIVAGCATGGASGRIEHGVYHSSKGYRIALPGPPWTPSPDRRADLTLTHAAGSAGMLVNASCDARATRRPATVLARQLLLGFRARGSATTDEVTVSGRTATHEVLEGTLGADAPPVKVELYVMKDDRCVYDLLYVAPPPAFEATRPDFQRFVTSFATDAPASR